MLQLILLSRLRVTDTLPNSMDIQFTKKELSDYLNDVFWIEFLKAFNAGSTYFYYLRRCT